MPQENPVHLPFALLPYGLFAELSGKLKTVWTNLTAGKARLDGYRLSVVRRNWTNINTGKVRLGGYRLSVVRRGWTNINTGKVRLGGYRLSGEKGLDKPHHWEGKVR